MFEVGLGFQEELGEVFGHLLTDRVLQGSHVRSVQRLKFRGVIQCVGEWDTTWRGKSGPHAASHVCRAAHSPSPHAVKRKKRIR